MLEGSATTATSTRTTAQARGTEVTFIGFNDANETAQLGELMSGNHATKKGVVTINGVAIEPQEHRRFRGFDIQTETPDGFQKVDVDSTCSI